MSMATDGVGAISMSEIAVLGSSMAYRTAQAGRSPVALFLHGNPTSSYIWRNIIPHVASVACCVAPDLIGFGRSGKPRIDYRFADHVRYLDAFLDGLGIHSAYVPPPSSVATWCSWPPACTTCRRTTPMPSATPLRVGSQVSKQHVRVGRARREDPAKPTGATLQLWRLVGGR
jgi:hypothetical protein